MAGVRFTDVQARPTEFLDLTSVRLDEFQQLIPPFEAAFQAHMAVWRLDGTPRTARQFRVYKNCPLPTPEDRLFFLLTYLKTYSLQVVQGRLFGMGQSKAHQWIHVLLPALQVALRTLGDTPARSLTALAQRLGVTEADAATVVAPQAEEPAPVADTPVAGQAIPLLCELARKKENPSLDRCNAPPSALCVASGSPRADAPSTITSFSAERPVLRGRDHSRASRCLFVRAQEPCCASHLCPCWLWGRHKGGDEVAVDTVSIPV
jgi:hypothetical protein